MKTIKGTYDILSIDSLKWKKLEQIINELCWVYDYSEIRTPIFEDTKVFKRENDSSDMVNKEMYTFEVGRNSLTLRPEGTAGVIRSFCQHKLYANTELPQKYYYIGPMFRHENPQKGRQRQFHQFGVENIGVKSPIVDAETIALGYSLIKSVGLSSVKVLINTLGDKESRNNYHTALKEYFKPFLSELCEDCQKRYENNPLRILDCKKDCDHPKVKKSIILKDYLTKESTKYFEEVLKALDDLEIPYEIENRLVRGLDYYTDTVFELVSTHDDAGSQSTIFGGGRYDGLVEYFGGPKMSGVGFAVGLERLLLMLDAEDVDFAVDDDLDIYVISMGDVGNYALQVATTCRAYGYKTSLNVVDRSMKSQFKSVDRRNTKVIIIIGEDEVKNEVVSIKFTCDKSQETASFDNFIEVIDDKVNQESHKCNCKGED
ncbi:MAG: histidine--tRNA ligase [Anaerorhabdus sp.]